MEAFTENESGVIRLLGLGNEILADDAFGILVAREVEWCFPGQIEVVHSSAAGYDLMEHLLGASRLLVVDTIVTGRAKPGAISVFTADRVQPAPPGGSPHFLGLFEVLAVGRKLHLDVPKEIVVIAVEASDCITVGGPIHPDVQSAIPEVVELVGRFLANGTLDNPDGWEQ
jgi:hydrogenase maturation protease